MYEAYIYQHFLASILFPQCSDEALEWHHCQALIARSSAALVRARNQIDRLIRQIIYYVVSFKDCSGIARLQSNS